MRSDAELVASAMGGGAEAFVPIVERYQDAVFGVALARLRNFHDAEDVAQGVLVEAYERLERLKDPSRLGAWLRSIAIHRSIDSLRRRREVVGVAELEEQAAETPTPRVELEGKDLRDRVMDAIGRLSKAQRETTALFYINGYSIDEVAAMQEVPAGTVKRRLHDARAKLKEEMLSVVEDVLKSEAPKEDFAQRVFELISKPLLWREWVAELRKIGPAGIDGFIRGSESPDWRLRRKTMELLNKWHAPQKGEAVIELLKRALHDPNKKVRRNALGSLLYVDVDDERKRGEFVPLVIPMLFDHSSHVRRAAAWVLREWPDEVPLEKAVRALLDEKNPRALRFMRNLLRCILCAREGGEQPKDYIWW